MARSLKIWKKLEILKSNQYLHKIQKKFKLNFNVIQGHRTGAPIAPVNKVKENAELYTKNSFKITFNLQQWCLFLKHKIHKKNPHKIMFNFI